MKNFRTSTLLVALFAGLTLLTACDKAPAPAPTPKAEAPAPAPVPAEQPAEQPAAAPDQAPADQPASTPDPHAAHAAALPAECESYLAQINECANKLSGHPAAADALKQQMEQIRASWAQTPDQGALGSACKQAADSFEQQAKGMGC